MIARIWNGRTRAEDYEDYSKFMQERAIPDYQATEGFLRLTFLRRIEGDSAHFQLITFWEDQESISKFAGVEYEMAKYYPEDKNYLLEFEERVTHYDVFATHRK